MEKEEVENYNFFNDEEINQRIYNLLSDLPDLLNGSGSSFNTEKMNHYLCDLSNSSNNSLNTEKMKCCLNDLSQYLEEKELERNFKGITGDEEVPKIRLNDENNMFYNSLKEEYDLKSEDSGELRRMLSDLSSGSNAKIAKKREKKKEESCFKLDSEEEKKEEIAEEGEVKTANKTRNKTRNYCCYGDQVGEEGRVGFININDTAVKNKSKWSL